MLEKGVALYRFYLNYTANALPTKLLKDFKGGGEVIRNVKHAGGLILLAKEEIEMQVITDRLIEIWKKLWNGNECGIN
jgi:hypothetical protein